MARSKVRKEHKTCMVCTKRYRTGAVLIYQGQPPAEEIGWGLCPAHAKQLDRNFIALVEIDPAKSHTPEPGETVAPGEVHRTGTVVYVSRPMFRLMFRNDPPESGVTFVPPEVVAILQRIKQAKDGTQPH